MRVFACPVDGCMVGGLAAEIEHEHFPTCPLMRVHCLRYTLPVPANKLATPDCIKELKSALKSIFFTNCPVEELQIFGDLLMDAKESWLLLHIAGQSTIRSGPREGPDVSKMAKLGSSQVSPSRRFKRKRSLQRHFYCDAHPEQTLRDRTSTLKGYVSQSATDSRASDTEASDMAWLWTAVSVRPLAHAAEAGQDLADFNFGDGANNAAAAQEARE